MCTCEIPRGKGSLLSLHTSVHGTVQARMCAGLCSPTLCGCPQPEEHRLPLRVCSPCRCLHASFASELAVLSTLLIPVGPTRCG